MVLSLNLFGSFAKDASSDAKSDVDLLVQFDPNQKVTMICRVAFFLEDLRGGKVEVVTPQSLNKQIGTHIKNSAE